MIHIKDSCSQNYVSDDDDLAKSTSLMITGSEAYAATTSPIKERPDDAYAGPRFILYYHRQGKKNWFAS